MRIFIQDNLSVLIKRTVIITFKNYLFTHLLVILDHP